jgi:hypothetical protein
MSVASCIVVPVLTKECTNRTYGSFGDAVGQFHRPVSVAVAENGHIIVADQENCRIQVSVVTVF